MKRLFIANRGEIARRIAHSAQHLGIQVVALTDRSTPPEYLSKVVDEFVHVDHESPALYLNPAKMIELATRAGCDSLHPGFGFLSENASFASQVIKAGLVWVGPTPEAIDAMASKETARRWALQAEVPCVPGFAGFSGGESSQQGGLRELEDFARKAGFPLLLKAAMGGGGKGMRLVHSMEELSSAAARASSEALSSFGDATLICERYVEASRHVEVQILGDQHGHVITVGDRDCSVQRRHQKIIEEAPAPDLTPETRRLLHEAALKLARRVGYTNAGTVEFLVDWSPAAQALPVTPFYFLEMNTRLQVEHPVSEEIFGIDLVEWQLRIARGERLPEWFGSAERGFIPRGHSVEVRIYAEDPTNHFLPAPGLIPSFQPASGRGIRWEVGLDSTDRITGLFDPMIAKLVATGATRRHALRSCVHALEHSVIFGPPNNTDFIRSILDKTPFAERAQATSFLKEYGDLIHQVTEERRQRVFSRAQSLLELLPQALDSKIAQTSLSSRPRKGLINAKELTELAFKQGESPKPLETKSSGTQRQATTPSLVHGDEKKLDLPQNLILSTCHQRLYEDETGLKLIAFGRGTFEVLSQGPSGKRVSFWYASMREQDQQQIWVQVDRETFTRVLTGRRRASSHESEGSLTDHELTAPVPGKIVSINVKEKDHVARGTILLVLESMKMEFEVKAPCDLQIDQLKVSPGDQVLSAQRLVEFTQKPLSKD